MTGLTHRHRHGHPGGEPGRETGHEPGHEPGQEPGQEPDWAGLLAAALARVDAPDIVIAVTRGGVRHVVSGGRAGRSAAQREGLRYETGSLSKTYTALLLAELAESGVLGLDDPLAAHLPGPPPAHPYARRITLRHLVTHTSGLPRIPRDLVAGALLRPYDNGYADYGTDRLLDAFARVRPRHAPGTRWRYSNFGAALLGTALAHAAGTDFGALLAARVLRPLGLAGTGLEPAGAEGDGEGGDGGGSGDGGDGRGGDATGYRADGRTPLPHTTMTAFAPAAAVRATPADLLSYTEAHLDPGAGTLGRALRRVRTPMLRHGPGHRQTRTLGWIQHPGPGGPLLFHTGASFGRQAFAGFHPASGTGVIAVATRHDRACRVIGSAHTLLYELASSSATARTPAHT
jgi:CubicO group peptidase (beta-lactamase class C family)